MNIQYSFGIHSPRSLIGTYSYSHLTVNLHSPNKMTPRSNSKKDIVDEAYFEVCSHFGFLKKMKKLSLNNLGCP